MDSDWDLLRRYAKGKDDGVFAELVGRHVDGVYGMARRSLGGPGAEAEDVTQAVFLLLAQKAGRIREKGVLAGWLFRVTRYCCLNVRREGEGGSGVNGRRRWLAKFRRSGRRRLRGCWMRGWARLSEKEREAVLAKFWEKRTAAEAGAMLGISAEAVEKRVERGVEKLRKFLAGRGYTVPAAGVAATMGAEMAKGAPAGLHIAVTVGSGSAVVIAKGATAMMKVATLKVAAGVGIVLVVIAGTVVVAAQRETGQGVAMMGAASQGVVVNGDYATTRKAAMTYLRAWRDGDWAAMREGLSGPASVMALERAKRDAMVAERELDAAVLERFGLQGTRVSHEYPPAAVWEAAMEVVAKGNETWSVKGDKQSFNVTGTFVPEPGTAERAARTRNFVGFQEFTKVEGGWKISKDKEAGALVTQHARDMEELFIKIAGDVRAGRYRTFREVENVVEAGTPKTVFEMRDGKIAMVSGGTIIMSDGPVVLGTFPISITARDSVRAAKTQAAHRPGATVVDIEDGELRFSGDSGAMLMKSFEMQPGIGTQLVYGHGPEDAATDREKADLDAYVNGEREKLIGSYGSYAKAKEELEGRD